MNGFRESKIRMDFKKTIIFYLQIKQVGSMKACFIPCLIHAFFGAKPSGYCNSLFKHEILPDRATI